MLQIFFYRNNYPILIYPSPTYSAVFERIFFTHLNGLFEEKNA